ncbi:MAG: cell division protein FtsB [Gammaproteobacteria bacterium]|nr:cell division protein FtsB [Gammaproteobacteria bacterium]
MKAVVAVLVILLLALQYQYWFGHGGQVDLNRLRDQISAQHAEIEALKARNGTLAAEVADLKQGMEAVEELARSEIGMIRDGEVFLQIERADTDGNAGTDVQP